MRSNHERLFDVCGFRRPGNKAPEFPYCHINSLVGLVQLVDELLDGAEVQALEDLDGNGWLDLYVVQSGTFFPDGSASAANPDGYIPMLWIFSVLGILGLVWAVLLRREETGPNGHGLETIKAGAVN